jgi:hypothetical protein
MENLNKNINQNFAWAVLASELSHVFCCVLPTLFTVISFAANIGMISAAPIWLMDMHESIHHYEIPIILFSGAMVCFGWAVHRMSLRVDCHDTGCAHPPCSPTKSRNTKILMIATILFLANVTIYATIHKNIFGLSFLPTNIQHDHSDHTSEIENDHHSH